MKRWTTPAPSSVSQRSGSGLYHVENIWPQGERGELLPLLHVNEVSIKHEEDPFFMGDG